MIPLFRTRHMEGATNLLVQHFRHVLIRAAYDNYVRIRFRADDVKGAMVYFNKVPSQRKKWTDNGGALLTWRDDNREGPHDAIVFVECPKSIGAMLLAIEQTRVLGVIYEPPSWQPHEDQIRERTKNAQPRRFERQMEKLEIVKAMVQYLPILTPLALQKLLARRAASPLSVAPVSPAAAVHPSDTAH